MCVYIYRHTVYTYKHRDIFIHTYTYFDIFLYIKKVIQYSNFQMANLSIRKCFLHKFDSIVEVVQFCQSLLTYLI